MTTSKILVTGANGQLGKELQAVAKLNPALEFVFLTREDLPINNSDYVRATLAKLNPQFCINCAAYTAVDKAEAETGTAFEVNGDATGELAAICKGLGAKFIHISTDYVFNGNADQPYKEDDEVDPVNAYGASKLKGEQLAIANNSESIVIRTSWVYSEFGNNFVKTMIRLMKERQKLGVVNDQFGSPTYAADLAMAITDIIKSGEWKAGIYHYSNEGIITWFDFAKAIGELTNSACVINPITTKDFPTPAKRPGFSGFDKSKIRKSYGLIIPEWKASLKICLQKLTN